MAFGEAKDYDREYAVDWRSLANSFTGHRNYLSRRSILSTRVPTSEFPGGLQAKLQSGA